MGANKSAFFHNFMTLMLCFLLAIIFLTGCDNSSVSSKYDVYNAHEHLGKGADVDALLRAMEKTGQKKMILLGSYENLLAKKKGKDYQSAEGNNRVILDAAAKHPDKFIPFVLLDTKMNDPVEMLKEYVKQGAKGVKLYNGLRSYRLIPADAPEMLPIYEYCQANHLPILIHMDVKRYPGELEHICTWFPDLVVIAPHLLCRPESPEMVAAKLTRFPNLYTDISYGYESWMESSFKKISKESNAVRKLIVNHKDRLLFGTDVCVSDMDYKTEDYLVNQFLGYRMLLEKEDFTFNIIKGPGKTETLKVHGLGLDGSVLQAVYEDNFNRLFGEKALAVIGKAGDAKKKKLPGPLWATDIPGEFLNKADGLKISARLDTPADGAFKAFFLLASHFEQPADGIAAAQLPDLLGGKLDWQSIGGSGGEITLIAPLSYKAVLEKAFPQTKTAQWVNRADVEKSLHENINALALIPMAWAQPRFKVLTIDSVSPFQNDVWKEKDRTVQGDHLAFDKYPVIVSIETDSQSTLDNSAVLQSLSFDPTSIKTLLVTGSSLAGQGIAYDQTPPADSTWPMEKIAPYFRSMDLAHISHECPLVENCVQKKNTWKFCGEKHNIEAFKLAGFDVMELTGNHQNDFGHKTTLATYDLYEKAGMTYFGGGRDREDAEKTRILNVRGLKIAFIGMNAVSGSAKLAGKKQPGSRKIDEVALLKDLREAKKTADAVFVHFQWGPEFEPTPWPWMVETAHRAIEEGATAVIGTHAHRTSAMEFFDSGTVFYGLGNFLFTHAGDVWTERSVAVKFAFLGDRLVNVEPMGVAIENFQLRFLNDKEEDELLARLYSHSPKNLASFATYPIVSLNTRATSNSAYSYVESAMNRAGIDVGIVGGYFDKMPTAAQAEKANSKFLAMKPKRIANIKVQAFLHPEADPDVIDRYEGKGAVSLVLAVDAKPAYPANLLEKAAEFGTKNGRILSLWNFESGDPTPKIAAILPKLSNANVVYMDNGILAGAPELLRSVLKRFPKLTVSLQACPDRALENLANVAETKPVALADVIRTNRKRIIAGFGLAALGDYKHKNKEVQGLWFRAKAFRNIFEKENYHFPILSHKKSEWSYLYEKEKERQGLALEPDLIRDLYYNNLAKLLNLAPLNY